MFAQEEAAEIEAREDVLGHSFGEDFVYSYFPRPDWKKTWSTNLLECVNEEIKRRTRVVGIFPNDTAITRLVGAVLLEQDGHWQLEGPPHGLSREAALNQLPTQPSLQDATA